MILNDEFSSFEFFRDFNFLLIPSRANWFSRIDHFLNNFTALEVCTFSLASVEIFCIFLSHDSMCFIFLFLGHGLVGLLKLLITIFQSLLGPLREQVCTQKCYAVYLISLRRLYAYHHLQAYYLGLLRFKIFVNYFINISGLRKSRISKINPLLTSEKFEFLSRHVTLLVFLRACLSKRRKP